MLTEDQIDYLFQIKESKPKIPDDTVMVMLKALHWTSEEIKRGIAFLKRPPESAIPSVRSPYVSPEDIPPQLDPSIVIKQNPFPIGSPFAGVLKQQEEKKHSRLTLAVAIIGAVIFLAGVLVYARLGAGL